MSFLVPQHVAAAAFFIVLIAFELLRRTRRVSLVRQPTVAYYVRAGLAATYFALVGLDPLVWLGTNVDGGVLLGAALAVGVAVLRRAEASALRSASPAMLVPAAFLAVVVAFVEELIFRGAFVLPATATSTAAILAILGSSVAYASWRAIAFGQRSPSTLGLSLAASVTLGAATALTRSLWPAFLAHAAFALVAGPPRPAKRRATAP